MALRAAGRECSVPPTCTRRGWDGKLYGNAFASQERAHILILSHGLPPGDPPVLFLWVPACAAPRDRAGPGSRGPSGRLASPLTAQSASGGGRRAGAAGSGRGSPGGGIRGAPQAWRRESAQGAGARG